MSLFSWHKKQPDASSAKDSLTPSDVNEILYKRNAELAIKNKALSLLGNLYETSILTLTPEDLARKISDSVREALNYESVSMFQYDKENDALDQIGYSRSDRYEEQLRLSGIKIDYTSIDKASTREFFDGVMNKRQPVLNEKFGFIHKNGVLAPEEIKMLADRAHIKSSIVYPLALGEHVLGMLLISMNREYDSLPDYEKGIIGSIVNVVSLALDKSLTYEALQDANEKLKSVDKLKTEFLSLAAHQLRSPLTAIRGYTSMLLDGSFGTVDTKQKEAINRVFESSSHLTKIVEDLLNVSKIEAGGMKYEMAPFDLEKPVHDLTTDLSITAEKKGLKLSFATDNKGPYTINGDMEKIRQVVLNVIDNAIKYTMQGSISVLLARNEATKMVRIAVTDTGMGISAEEKEKLFQKFSRGEGGKTNTSGSGLGLYLAKQIAEAHGGEVVIDSPGAGKGSTFTIELKAM
ncbi:MAG: GAF domain-containing sensor histidine kinase [bacterium]